jgi:hypothetical protein
LPAEPWWGKTDRKQGARVAFALAGMDRGAMAQRNLLHDGQAQAASRLAAAGDAVEAFEHEFPLLGRDARAVIFNLQPGRIPVAHPHGDVATLGGVADGVVQQVVDQIPQAGFVALDGNLPVDAFEAQVDVLAQGLGHPVGRRVLGHPMQVQQFHGRVEAGLRLVAGQGQELVDQVAAALGAVADAAQGLAHRFGQGFPLCQFRLGLEAGEGRAQLVGGVCHEAALGVHHGFQAFDQRVHLQD